MQGNARDLQVVPVYMTKRDTEGSTVHSRWLIKLRKEDRNRSDKHYEGMGSMQYRILSHCLVQLMVGTRQWTWRKGRCRDDGFAPAG